MELTRRQMLVSSAAAVCSVAGLPPFCKTDVDAIKAMKPCVARIATCNVDSDLQMFSGDSLERMRKRVCQQLDMAVVLKRHWKYGGPFLGRAYHATLKDGILECFFLCDTELMESHNFLDGSWYAVPSIEAKLSDKYKCGILAIEDADLKCLFLTQRPSDKTLEPIHKC